MNRKRRFFACAQGLAIASLMACSHTHDATPPIAAAKNATQSPAKPQQATITAQEKSGPRTRAEYEAPPMAAEEPPPVFVDSIKTFMLEHFIIATWVRDSVVDGNLAGIGTPLTALAEYGYQSVAPGGWMTDIAQLQAAARLTAQSKTLAAAARGVAAIGRVCGECHQAHGGPDIQRYKQETLAPKTDSFEGRMFRHAWAVERLWEGLTTPSDEAWAAGAAALAHAPGTPPKAKPALPATVVQTLNVVRGLGTKATAAESFEQREKLYGELLVTCAECHRSSQP
ncbi:MAG TPA: hypothetical protein VFN67_04010 [Polyangiales bacterium]|nr:hypothetical protein [Polyangiales bacterium]